MIFITCSLNNKDTEKQAVLISNKNIKFICTVLFYNNTKKTSQNL